MDVVVYYLELCIAEALVTFALIRLQEPSVCSLVEPLQALLVQARQRPPRFSLLILSVLHSCVRHLKRLSVRLCCVAFPCPAFPF